VSSLVDERRPAQPVFCLRPHVISEAARRFRAVFPGRVLYAVKCNPHPLVLSALHEGGIRDFDAASLSEIAQVRRAFRDARAHFMHPVKDRDAVRSAHASYGVRHFAIDCGAELEKLLDELPAAGLFVFVRVETRAQKSGLHTHALRFGAEPTEAAQLVREAARHGCRVGLTFQVGSQCLEPRAYRDGIDRLGEVIERSRLAPAAIDVGGGFPQTYPQREVPALEDYVDQIRRGVRTLGLRSAVELWAEPGRALVASGGSVLTRVMLRREQRLYLSDGVYGSFSELLESTEVPPSRLYSQSGEAPTSSAEFVAHGPTCDASDVFAAKLELPANVREGDWVEIGEAGAYSSALATRFNGFGVDCFAEVADEPVARAEG
jgi:ornithine decarboxylase